VLYSVTTAPDVLLFTVKIISTAEYQLHCHGTSSGIDIVAVDVFWHRVGSARAWVCRRWFRKQRLTSLGVQWSLTWYQGKTPRNFSHALHFADSEFCDF